MSGTTFGGLTNLILYGPPGTGKTYLAKKIAEKIIANQIESQNEEIALQGIVDELQLYQLIALAMYDHDPKSQLSVDEIKVLPLIRTRYSMYPIKRQNESIWGSLQIHSNPESITINVANHQFPYLFNKTEEAKWYLDKEGIEYVIQNFSEDLDLLRKNVQSLKESDFVKWITFHQSFSYEEFIEGLRPVVDEETEGINHIEIVPGVFKTICARASAQSSFNYVLIIDEINRGNISRIFGELITLIEDDKREDAKNEISVVLPYSKDTFKVPKNLYLIGTMNTSDRSIALLDAALRRRFAFMEVIPNYELLQDIEVGSGDLTINLAELLEYLNKKLQQTLDKDHQIGHSYFLKIGDYKKESRIDALEFVWNYQILPFLEEYFYSQPDRFVEILKPFFVFNEGSDKEESSILMHLEGEELLAALNELIE